MPCKIRIFTSVARSCPSAFALRAAISSEMAMSPATRKVAEGGTNVGHIFTGDQTNMVVLSLASGLCHSDKKVPEIIALRRPDGASVILEGHARATAIVLEAHRFPNGVHAYIGDGPSVASWPCERCRNGTSGAFRRASARFSATRWP